MECAGFICCMRKTDVYRIQKELEEKVNVDDLVVVNPAVGNGDLTKQETGVDDVVENIQAEETQKEMLRKQLADIEKETADLKVKIQNEEIERDILRAKVNAEDSGEKKELTKKIEAERKDVERLEEQLKALQQDNKKADLLQKIAEEEIVKENVQQQVDLEQSLLEQTENLKSKLELTTTEKMRLQNELDMLDKEIPKLNESVKERTEEKMNLHEHLDTAQGEIAELTKEIASAEEEKKKLIEKEAIIKHEVSELNQKMKIQESEKNSLSRKQTIQDKGNHSLRAQIAAAKSENDELKKRIEQKKLENDKLVEESKNREVVDQLEQEKSALQEKLAMIENERNELLMRVETMAKVGDESEKKEKDLEDDKLYLKTDGVFSLPIRVSQPKKPNDDRNGKSENVAADEEKKNTPSGTSNEGNSLPTIQLTDSGNDGTSHDDLAEIELTMRKMSVQTNDTVHDAEPVEENPEGFISDLELEKIAQSTYRYSYHQYVENYQEHDDEED